MKKLSLEQEKELCDLYPTTRTQILSEKYKISRSTVRNTLIYHHVQLKPKHIGNKYNFNIHFFDTIDNEEKAYFLGLLYADGCLYEPHHKVVIELNERDKDILIKIQNVINSNHPLSEFKRKAKISGKINNYLCLNLVNHYFFAACQKQGLTPRKSLTLKFPNINQVPSHLLNHFIRGYFDGDGSLSILLSPHRRTAASIISTTQFCKQIKKIVDKSCGQHTGTLIKNKDIPSHSFFRTTGNVSTLRFLDFLYKNATIFLDRKWQKYQYFLSIRKTIQRQSYATSRFFGVQKHRSNKFVASFYIKSTKKSKRLGIFDTQEDAARAYDNYCIEIGQNLHKLNFS